MTTLPDASEVLSEVEALVHSEEEPELEADLSVNEWIGRIRGAAGEAHGFARTGEDALEERAWLQIAAIATRRVQHIRARS